MIQLDVILRTCSRTGVFTPQQVPRIVTDDRKQMIYKCVASLIRSLNNCSYDIRLTVFDDHSDPEGLATLHKIVDKCRHPHQFFPTQTIGFNNSAYEQFQFGRDHGRQLVYFVEDDYFHQPQAIQQMVEAYLFFRHFSGINEVAISPWDQPDEYELRFIQPTKIYYFQNHYWRTTISTTNTVLWNVAVIRTGWELFKKLALEYGQIPGVEEINTTGLLLNNGVTHRGPVTCFSPIPSIGLHIHHKGQGTPKAISTEMFDWEHQWNGFQLDELQLDSLI